MGQYLVVEPCAYVTGEKSVHHREAGAVVEIDDDTAKDLGPAVKPFGDAATKAKTKAVKEVPLPKASVTVDGVDQGQPKVGTRPDDAHPGEVIGG